MNKRIEEELFPFYALDALTDEEKAEVEAYIANDPAAKTRLHNLQQTADLLPLTTEPVAPSPQLKANLMARVQADSRAKMGQTAVSPKTTAVKRPSTPQPTWLERLRQGFAFPVLAGTAAFAAILLFIWVISLNQQLNQLQNQIADLSAKTTTLQGELDSLEGDNTQLRVQNETLQQQLNNQNEMLAAYQQPGTSTIAISDNTGENPNARATLTVQPDSSEATFVAANLPPLSADQVYQLWIIRGDLPISAGIFELDENGRVVLPVDGALAASFDAVGVSIEPAGGSESPTPDQIILLGAASS
jgi:anti-sigma-K factor RskA/cell division protein FtsB